MSNKENSIKKEDNIRKEDKIIIVACIVSTILMIIGIMLTVNKDRSSYIDIISDDYINEQYPAEVNRIDNKENKLVYFKYNNRKITVYTDGEYIVQSKDNEKAMKYKLNSEELAFLKDTISRDELKEAILSESQISAIEKDAEYELDVTDSISIKSDIIGNKTERYFSILDELIDSNIKRWETKAV